MYNQIACISNEIKEFIYSNSVCYLNTGYLYHLSGAIVSGINEGNENADVDLLKVITSPLAKFFIQVHIT